MEEIARLKIQFPNDSERIEAYWDFAKIYEIPEDKFADFVRLYDINELENAMPKSPNSFQKKLFTKLIGVEGNAVYLDYFRSNNSFEIVMQFFECDTDSIERLNQNFGFKPI